jgi:hypothetical protein
VKPVPYHGGLRGKTKRRAFGFFKKESSLYFLCVLCGGGEAR